MDDTQPSNLSTGVEAIKTFLNPPTDQPTQQASDEAPAPQTEVNPEELPIEGEESQGDESLYEVKVDGEVKKVPLEELIKGYQLEAHYTQKSQKLAEERKALETERAALSGVNQKFEQLNEVVTYLTQVNNYVESTIPPEPDESLLDTSPREFYRQQKAREAAIQSLMAIRGTIDHTKAQAKEVVKELQKAGAAVISQKMPELMTNDGANRLYGYLQDSYGYSSEQIQSNIDPNLFIIAEKARRYDEIQGKVVKPVSNPQRVMKQQAPRNLNQNSDYLAAKKAFKERGDTKSSIPVFKNILNNK